MSKKRVEYSESFKAEAIAKVKENNGNISQTAKELGIPMNTDPCCQERRKTLGRLCQAA